MYTVKIEYEHKRERVNKWNATQSRYDDTLGNMYKMKATEKGKSRQHPDFPGGHPPEYYPILRLLYFTDRKSVV